MYPPNHLNTRAKLHYCRGALVSALIPIPLENTVKPHKRKPLIIRLHLLHNPLLPHMLPLPRPPGSHWMSKLLPLCSPPSFLPKASGHRVTQVNTRLGHHNASEKKEGNEAHEQQATVSCCPRHTGNCIETRKKCTHEWRTVHRDSCADCFQCSQTLQDIMNLI